MPTTFHTNAAQVNFNWLIFKEKSSAVKLYIGCETLDVILEVVGKPGQKQNLNEMPSNASTKLRNRKAIITWLIRKIKASFKNNTIL